MKGNLTYILDVHGGVSHWADLYTYHFTGVAAREVATPGIAALLGRVASPSPPEGLLSTDGFPASLPKGLTIINF